FLVLAFVAAEPGEAADKKAPPRERSKAWELATHVVVGKVTALERLSAAGESSSDGPRFSLSLTVSRPLKGKGPRRGQQMTLGGWQEGKEKQRFLPRVNDQVEAYLRQRGDSYALLVPDGFSAAQSPPKKKAKKSDD